VPNVDQSPKALEGIVIGFIWVPALFYALAIVPVLFYGRFESLEPRIHEDLRARRGAP
jgi:Na+/melibiose symporter-like transporter